MTFPALLANYVNYGDGSTTGYFAVTKRPQNTAVAAGILRRQFTAPSVGNERVFVCIVAGTTQNVTDATWVVTRGSKTTDGTATWQECTGQPATNGDLTNTRTWTSSKAAASTPSLGVIIKDASNNLFICTTSGPMGGSEPTWNTTKGATTTDLSAVWTCISNGAYGAWAAPHARLANACGTNFAQAGDDIYIASASAETQASAISHSFPGTTASPIQVICVNAAGSVPPASADITTGASITTTGANAITYSSGYAYIKNIAISTGSGANVVSFTTFSASGGLMIFDGCTISLGGTSGGNFSFAGTGLAGAATILKNTTLKVASTSSSISIGSRFYWYGTSLDGAGSLPTTLFVIASGGVDGVVQGVDLSALGSGKTLVSDNSTNVGYLTFIDCKLGASVTLTSGASPSRNGLTTRFINCDSGNTNNHYFKDTYQGTITQETTIVRSGGASDGTNQFSRKMVTTANSKFYDPLISDWIELWNETTGSSVTLTVPVITDNVTLKDNEAWLEVEGLTTSSFPLGVFSNDAAADVLAAGSNQTTDGTSSWTTTGLTTPVKQSLAVTITPQVKGIIRCRVCLAKATTTMYFDPLAVASSGRQFQGSSAMVNECDQAATTDVRNGTTYNRANLTGSYSAGGSSGGSPIIGSAIIQRAAQ